jgi:hypothetical protein
LKYGGIDKPVEGVFYYVHPSRLAVQRRGRSNVGPLEVRPRFIKFRPMTGEGGLHSVCLFLYIVAYADFGGHDVEAEDLEIVSI